MWARQAALPNAFTVDLEDWYHGLTSTNRVPERWPALDSRVVSLTRTLLAILAAHNVKATFFVLGCVAEEHPFLLEEVTAEGHEIGVHGHTHRFVNRMAPDEFRRELDQATAAIYRVTGMQPVGHRAPYFSVDGGSLWALDIMSECGMRYDSSVFPVRNMLYGYAGAPREPYRAGTREQLLEIPVSTVRIGKRNVPFAGGFYMRSWPYAFVRWAVKRVRSEGLPAIFYIHPWELDLDQPRMAATSRERLTHYHGRGGLRRKLEQLLTEFRFVPLSHLLEMEWPV